MKQSHPLAIYESLSHDDEQPDDKNRDLSQRYAEFLDLARRGTQLDGPAVVGRSELWHR